MIEEFQARLCYSCKHGTKPVAPESIKAKALQQDQKVVSAKGQTPAQTEPEWVEDGDVAQCASCNDSFSLFNRKHHCRGGMHISTAVATELQWKAAGLSERAAKVRERATNIRFWDDSGFLVGLVRQQSSIGAF